MSSWNDVTKKVREIRKNFVVRCAISFVAVLASALLQSYVILAFIRPAGLLSSGFTVWIYRLDIFGTRCFKPACCPDVLPQHQREIHGVFAAAGIFCKLFLKSLPLYSAI